MMEGNPEMPQRPNLTSMTNKEFFEMVWEDGQLLMRNLSRRAQRNPSCNVHPSDKAHVHVKNGGDTFPLKRARFANLDSVLDNPYHDKRNLYMNFNYINCLEDDNFHESLPEVYQTHLYEFLEQNKGDSSVKYHKESQVVPENANLRRNTKSSTKQYRELAPFKRPRAISRKNLVTIGEFPMAKLQEQDLKSGGKRVTTNFSTFLGSPALLQVNSQWTGPANAEDLNNNCKRSSPCGNINPLESMPIAAANGSKSVKGFHDQTNLMETTVELLPLGAKPADKLLPDNESEALRREYASPNQIYGQTLNIAANKGKGKLTNTQKAIELPVATSSLCSGGASNNPTYTLKRKYDDTEGSADHPSQNIERKAKSVTKAVPGSKNKAKSITKTSKRNRKKRTAEFHNLSERKRRDKINEKMRALQELIPNCNKVDKASMLDEAIEYLKILQLRVQMMSMGNRVCVPQMVLPNGMQQTRPQPQLTPVSPTRMHMGIGCNPFPFPPNFLFPPIPRATAMPGFSPQLLPMSPLPAQLGLLNTNVNFPGISLASSPTQLKASATLSNSKDSIHSITSEEGKIHSC